MVLRRLDHILGTKTKVVVLRLLCTNRKQFTGREIARRTGRGVVNVHRALRELVAAGVVEVEEKRVARLFHVTEHNPLVKQVLIPLFEGESRIEQELWDELAAAGESEVVSVVVFGSQARGEATVASDVDVLVVVSDQRHIEAVRERAQELGLRHGISIQAISVDLAGLPQWARDNAGLWAQIVEEGIALRGVSLYKLDEYVRKGIPITG